MDYYSQCEQMLRSAIAQLGFEVEDKEIINISELIVEAMGGNFRYFHTFEHIIMVSYLTEPLLTLAGLFHDLVYINVDGKIPFNLCPYLTPYVREKQGDLWVKDDLLSEDGDKLLSIILAIFGLNRGENLTKFRGINEFLSGLIASELLREILPLSLITRLLVIIELTIPFRFNSLDDNKSIPYQLQNRLETVNDNFQLGLSQEEVVNTVMLGVKFANLDVSGFASADKIEFLNNTWLLLPETNHTLQNLTDLTIKDYCLALYKTSQFISSLSPHSIFQCYQGYPSITEINNLINQSKLNLDITKFYLNSQLIGLTILWALSTPLSPSLSLSFFFDFSSNTSDKSFSITDYLPLKNFSDNSLSPFVTSEIIPLLKSSYHPPFSPPFPFDNFTLFILQHLSSDDIINIAPSCYLFSQFQLNSSQFLSLFPPSLINSISSAIELLLQDKGKMLIKV